MTDLTWQKALRVWGFTVTPEVRVGGWPDSLALWNIARLQYPREGTDGEKSKAVRNQQAIAASMKAAIFGEALHATEHRQVVKRPTPKPRRVARSSYLSDLGSPEWRTDIMRAAPVVPPAPAPVEQEELWYTVTRADFRDWLATQGEEPSEHIRAWLRPLEQAAEARQAETKPVKQRRETQGDRVARWLAECERRAAELGKPFDRKRMPGTKAEFLDLLHALDAYLRSVKTVDSLDRYLNKTGCKWPLDASAQPSAAHLYESLFPEARIRTPGAVSPQRRKA